MNERERDGKSEREGERERERERERLSFSNIRNSLFCSFTPLLKLLKK